MRPQSEFTHGAGGGDRLELRRERVAQGAFRGRCLGTARDRRRFRARGRCAQRRARASTRRAMPARWRATPTTTSSCLPSSKAVPPAAARRPLSLRDGVSALAARCRSVDRAGRLGRAASCAPRPACTASATTRCSRSTGAGAPPRSSTRPRRTASAIAARRCGLLLLALQGDREEPDDPAARALRPPAVVRAQVPVLRLQLAPGAAAAACRKKRTFERCSTISSTPPPIARAGRSSRCSSAAARRACSPRRRSSGCWHARARCCRWRPASRSRSRQTPARSSIGPSPRTARRASIAYRWVRRVSTTGISRRSGEYMRRRRRVTAVAELRAAGLDNFNLDLMYALPAQDVSGGARRYRGGARARARAPVALPAHARAGHGVRESAAAAAGRGRELRDAGGLPVAPGGRGIRAVRSLRVRTPGGAVPPQPQLLGVRRLPGRRRRRARQAHAAMDASRARRVTARRRVTWRPRHRRRASPRSA